MAYCAADGEPLCQRALLAGLALPLLWLSWKITKYLRTAAAIRPDSKPRGLKVVIQGSSRGLGLALAREFLALGDDVAISSRDAAAVQACVQQLQRDFPGRQVVAAPADAAQPAQVEALAAAALEQLGRIDIWVANAALSAARKVPVTEAPAEELAAIVNANLTGALLAAHAALPRMAPGGKFFLVDGSGSNGRPTAGVDFVRKAVRAIGYCAVSIPAAAERCINVLLELIQTKVNYVVQESIIVIKDIFRRYPNKYESIIGTLCDSLESLDEPEAKASMIWIIGEYAERIDNADELLEQFLESFPEETAAVQLQLMTATVKLFLKKPVEKPQQLIQLVLTYATQETDNPDLRDRAYIYWRLLSTDPEAAKDVVLAEKPTISGARDEVDSALLRELLSELGSLASVYHKPAASFVSKLRLAVQRADDLAARAAAARTSGSGEEMLTSAAVAESPMATSTGATPTAAAAARPAAAPVPDLLGDLLELDVPAPTAAAAAPAAAAAAAADLPVVFGEDRGKGVVVRARLSQQPDGAHVYEMAITNASAGVPLDGWMIQFNRNALGLVPASQQMQLDPVLPGATAAVRVPLAHSPGLQAPEQGAVLQVAVKSNQLGVLYFADQITQQAAAPAAVSAADPLAGLL